ncbi:MAG: lipid-A-disaccharide synthase [Bacteroidaceae bacterium]|nr:lipid-A-disaccharide synthase [Bacteroidaceae bacterium]
MKYYLIVGEASGDLHASNLIRAIAERDPEAEFRFFGGDKMKAVGGTMVKHYRELAYMGFIPVLLHLRTILSNMKRCRLDVLEWKPDVLILVDYPGFNLSIAEYVKKHSQIPVYYYISPKIWAWKEHRIKNIKRDVDQLFSILPFEIKFFEQKHGYPINYVGNPCVDAVDEFRSGYAEDFSGFVARNSLSSKPIVALLSGSRRQEIKDNLPEMLSAIRGMDAYQFVIAGAPGIERDYYNRFIEGTDVSIVFGQTYELLSHSEAALVTSGTATLETALMRVPQVVLYRTPLPHLLTFLKNHLLKVRFVSLVNLIADREVVRELVASLLTTENIRTELEAVLPGGMKRQTMLDDYDELARILGPAGASQHAADRMIELLRKKS